MHINFKIISVLFLHDLSLTIHVFIYRRSSKKLEFFKIEMRSRYILKLYLTFSSSKGFTVNSLVYAYGCAIHSSQLFVLNKKCLWWLLYKQIIFLILFYVVFILLAWGSSVFICSCSYAKHHQHWASIQIIFFVCFLWFYLRIWNQDFNLCVLRKIEKLTSNNE